MHLSIKLYYCSEKMKSPREMSSKWKRSMSGIIILFLLFSCLNLVSATDQTSTKLRVIPISQHVDSVVANKLQAILPTFSARVWGQVQHVKRELRADLRRILLLLEEHAGVGNQQTVRTDTNSVYVNSSVKDEGCKSINMHKNITKTLQKLENKIAKALSTVSEKCGRNIQENNELMLSQQGGILRSLQLINEKLDTIDRNKKLKSAKPLPFPASNMVGPTNLM